MPAADSCPWLSVVIPIKDEREDLLALTEGLLRVLRSALDDRGGTFEVLAWFKTG